MEFYICYHKPVAKLINHAVDYRITEIPQMKKIFEKYFKNKMG